MLENIVTVVERYWSLFLSGLGYTLLLALITVVCGTILGSLIALMRMARFRPYRGYPGHPAAPSALCVLLPGAQDHAL